MAHRQAFPPHPLSPPPPCWSACSSAGCGTLPRTQLVRQPGAHFCGLARACCWGAAGGHRHWGAAVLASQAGRLWFDSHHGRWQHDRVRSGDAFRHGEHGVPRGCECLSLRCQLKRRVCESTSQGLEHSVESKHQIMHSIAVTSSISISKQECITVSAWELFNDAAVSVCVWGGYKAYCRS